jgi:predicted transcriptional regulator
MNPWGSKSAGKRDRLEIVAEVLEIAKEKALKTQIMYRAGLSFTQVNSYLRFMLEATLLNKSEKNNRSIYRATEKGIDFLHRYRDIIELIRREDKTCKINGKVPPSHLLRKVKSIVYMPKSY